MVIGCFTGGGGPVDCYDWTRVHCAVDFSPGGVWIGYVRQELWDGSLILATSHCAREDAFGCVTAPTRRGLDFVEHSGPPAVRNIPQPDVLGGHACGL